ncbi:hypothetical protein ACHAXS_013617 [Conticribra weissflogii]
MSQFSLFVGPNQEDCDDVDDDDATAREGEHENDNDGRSRTNAKGSRGPSNDLAQTPSTSADSSSSLLRRSRSLSPALSILSPSLAHDAHDTPYRPHFSPRDFSSRTWTAALDAAPSLRSALRATGAAVLAAAIIVHPLLGAAAATVWAVGRLQGEGEGLYQIWGAEDFARLFWMDPPATTTTTSAMEESGQGEDDEDNAKEDDLAIDDDDDDDAVEVMRVGHDKEPTRHAKSWAKPPKPVGIVKVKEVFGENTKTADASLVINECRTKREHRDNPRGQPQQQPQRRQQKDGVIRKPIPPNLRHPPLPSRRPSQTDRKLRRIRSEPVQTKPSNPTALSVVGPTAPPPEFPSRDAIPSHILLRRHYPPLSTEVVHRVAFPGLHPAEFFRVFFANDAPYSMKEFQTKNGDVDIVYGEWTDVDVETMGGRCSFKDGAVEPVSLPPNSVRERTLTFNTLTKSYFGPAYARATKTQRLVQLSDRLLVIENQTSLADIPYADRFRVVERWIVEAVRNDDADDDDRNNHRHRNRNRNCNPYDTARYATALSVHAEVVMLKSCSFESQIRNKASQTFTEMVTKWCETAKAALQATEERKQQRLTPSVVVDGEENADAVNAPSTGQESKSTLLERHRQNLEELDKWIRNGDLDLDLEWCSVEVVHSSEAGYRSESAPVLVFPNGKGRDHVEGSAAAVHSVEASVAAVDGNARVEQRRGSMRRKFLRRIGSKAKVPRSGDKSR